MYLSISYPQKTVTVSGKNKSALAPHLKFRSLVLIFLATNTDGPTSITYYAIKYVSSNTCMSVKLLCLSSIKFVNKNDYLVDCYIIYKRDEPL